MAYVAEIGPHWSQGQGHQQHGINLIILDYTGFEKRKLLIICYSLANA